MELHKEKMDVPVTFMDRQETIGKIRSNGLYWVNRDKLIKVVKNSFGHDSTSIACMSLMLVIDRLEERITWLEKQREEDLLELRERVSVLEEEP